MPRKSFWAWGMEPDEPTMDDLRKEAARVSAKSGVLLEAGPPTTLAELDLRKPRISPPASLSSICSTDTHDRAVHSYGRGFRDRVRAFNRHFPNPPDVVAFPRDEQEVVAVLDWCSRSGYAAIPYGGGSSVVGGVEPPEASDGAVSIDVSALDRVLEIDEVSRAARIQAGVYGPALDDQLRPHGFTMRHFPQSYEYSSLGGWIATRSGGHYATNYTHIDDLVESVRMVTPAGIWESRRLPGSGAGPSPDRLAIGSEGILGIITEAWMQIQRSPRFRASAGMIFPSLQAGAEAARHIVQAKLWPANCRVLDPGEAAREAGLDGRQALLVLGFESADIPQGEFMRAAISIGRDCGGAIDEDAIKITDATTGAAGRQGAVGSWRNSFLRAPFDRNLTVALGQVRDTVETAITWERWQGNRVLTRIHRRTPMDGVRTAEGGG